MKKYFEEQLEKQGGKLGIYDKRLDDASKRTANRILNSYGSLICTIKGKKYIVEIDQVDDETDYRVVTHKEFKEMNGYEYGEW